MSSCNQLATNTATLYALDDFQGEEEIPEMPLALHHERQLAEAFAFLAARMDNMYKVMAVAIEEHADSRGITVRTSHLPTSCRYKRASLLRIYIITNTLQLPNEAFDEQHGFIHNISPKGFVPQAVVS